VNIGAPWPEPEEAELRVLGMQVKLHRWAKADPGRRFDDLANLVYDPAFLVVAWNRVRGNKGARTAGVDGVVPTSIGPGTQGMLTGLREDLQAGRFAPERVREKTIPKSSGKIRRLGIPTAVDRVVQASVKLVLEPIFEAELLDRRAWATRDELASAIFEWIEGWRSARRSSTTRRTSPSRAVAGPSPSAEPEPLRLRRSQPCVGSPSRRAPAFRS